MTEKPKSEQVGSECDRPTGHSSGPVVDGPALSLGVGPYHTLDLRLHLRGPRNDPSVLP